MRRFGRVLGHRAGIHGDQLLAYLEARKTIYLPCYRWALDNRLQEPLAEIRKLSQEKTVVLLDYQTNGNVENLSNPLSHAAFIKRFLENDWPS